MTKQSIKAYFPRIINMAAPIAGTRLINMLTGFVGMLIAAHLGKTIFAACALINIAYIFFFVVGISLLYAIGVVAAQMVGAKNNASVGATFQQGTLLAILISVPIGICFYNMDHILLALGQKAVLMPYIRQYYLTAVWGVIPSFFLVVLQQICFATDNQRLVIYCNIICFFIFIPIAYCLILGLNIQPDVPWVGGLHFKSLGINGLSLAFNISNFMNTILLLFLVYKLKRFQPYKLFSKHAHTGLVHLRKLFQVGWPMTIQFSSEIMIFTVIGLFMGSFGESTLMAFQVVIQWEGLAIIPVFGISDAIGILIGHQAGAKQYDELNITLNATFVLIGGIMFAVMLCFIFMPDQLAIIYGVKPSDTVTLHIVRVFFYCMCSGIFLDTLRNSIAGALRGLHDTQYTMWTCTLTLYGITLPLGYFCVNIMHWGPQFYFIAYTIAFATGIALLYPRWLIMVKRLFNSKTAGS
jgi:multidrug resistance protein, MATE family